MQLINLLAIIGNISVAVSAIPQILKQIKSRSREGFSPLMPWCWIVGNLSMIVYNIFATKNIYLIVFFCINLVTSLLILYLYYFKSE